MTTQSNASSTDPATEPPEDPGPGCFPAVMAATLIMGMLFCIGCGLSAWVIFGKRTELAIRTLENNYIPLVEQSRLQPTDKEAILEEFEDLIRDMKADKYENWQSSGVMQRLVRLPIIQWGKIDAIQAYARSRDEAFASRATLHLSRLKRGVELNEIVALDLDDVLQPVTRPNVDDLIVHSLIDPLDEESVADVVLRAKLVADRAGVPDRVFEDVRIRTIVRRQIEAGLTQGTY